MTKYFTDINVVFIVIYTRPYFQIKKWKLTKINIFNQSINQFPSRWRRYKQLFLFSNVRRMWNTVNGKVTQHRWITSPERGPPSTIGFSILWHKTSKSLWDTVHIYQGKTSFCVINPYTRVNKYRHSMINTFFLV